MKFTQWKNRKPIKEILGDILVSPYYEEQVSDVLTNRKVSNERIKNLAYWVKYSVNDNYLKRFDRLLQHPKNDSSSKDIFILRYGDKEGLRRYNEKNDACTHTEESMIKRYGMKKGLKKWQQYKDNISFANSEEGYIKKYGEEEGKKRFKKQCERNAGNLTLERKIELFGEEVGLDEYNKMKVTLRERHSLENYINLYGEEEGTEKYIKLCEVRSYKNSLAYYVEKYGEEEGLKRIKKVKNNGMHFNNYSKISIELFENFKDLTNEYGNNETSIFLTEDEHKSCKIWSIKPDLTYGMKLIEFYGDRFHANPNMYDDDVCCHPFYKSITAKEIRDNDYKRIDILKQRGYDIKIVWEYDYKKNKNKIIEECRTFLMT